MLTRTSSASSSAATTGPMARHDDTLEALPQLCCSTQGACDIAEPSNLGRACKGNRINLARSHFGHNSDHARIVNF